MWQMQAITSLLFSGNPNRGGYNESPDGMVTRKRSISRMQDQFKDIMCDERADLDKRNAQLFR